MGLNHEEPYFQGRMFQPDPVDNEDTFECARSFLSVSISVSMCVCVHLFLCVCIHMCVHVCVLSYGRRKADRARIERYI